MERDLLEVLREYVIASIQEAFHWNVYGEYVEQNSKRPCFTVRMIDSQRRKLLANRREQKVSFLIEFYTEKKGNTMGQTMDVADKLYEVLSIIGEKDNWFAASQMHHSIRERGISFFVDYVFHIVLSQEEIWMERLEHNGKRVVGYETMAREKRGTTI